MATRNFVYSTLTCHQKYVRWRVLENGTHQDDGHVLIHGGANVATGSSPRTVTPKGVVTEVSEDEMAILMNDQTFKRHMAGGFIKVETVEAHPNKVAKDMTERAPDAPATPKSIAEAAERNGGALPAEDDPRSLLDRIRGKVA